MGIGWSPLFLLLPRANRQPSVVTRRRSSSERAEEVRTTSRNTTRGRGYAPAVGMEPAAGNTCDQMWWYYSVVEVLTRARSERAGASVVRRPRSGSDVHDQLTGGCRWHQRSRRSAAVRMLDTFIYEFKIIILFYIIFIVYSYNTLCLTICDIGIVSQGQWRRFRPGRAYNIIDSRRSLTERNQYFNERVAARGRYIILLFG